MGRLPSRAQIGLLLGIWLAVGAAAAATEAQSAPRSDPGFQPAAASFVSPTKGWVLGRTGCSDCAGVRLTTDGGRRWATLSSPRVPLSYYSTRPAAVSDIAFANATDGFLFRPGLLTTHDGGKSWRPQSLPPVQRLSVGGGYAFALTKTTTNNRPTLWRTPIGDDHWTRLPLPASGTSRSDASASPLELTVEGSEVLLFRPGSHGPSPPHDALGHIWRSTTSGTNWQTRAVPCTTADGGAALLAISRGRPRTWLADCFDDEQSSQEQDTRNRLYRSTDAGATWARLSDPTRHNEPALLADNGAGHFVLATQGGAGDALVGSFDDGRHWQPLLRSGGSFFGWADLRFLTAEIGYVVGPTHYAPAHLYRTTNGGRGWRTIRIG